MPEEAGDVDMEGERMAAGRGRESASGKDEDEDESGKSRWYVWRRGDRNDSRL